ncbi:hypothetical protein A0H81_13836 [Grifola frondosa]|uniref:F-box domain-containing protein n=1 Tax=Grifola frondosa TaxID=5627 RepID=A0A1C7LNF6_GRIFR|nr:hypothetical protein A0H81_13836 [Grifola frondosa]
MSFRPLIYSSEPNPLIGSSFGPLLEIRHLHDIVLNFHSWRYHCSSSDICAMAESWPELRTLAVRCTFSGIPPSVIATAEFARLCSNLQRLEFTCLSYPDSIPLDEYSQSCHGLEKFVVDDLSPRQFFEHDGPLRKHIDEQGEGLVDLARFLGRVFPRIDAARLCNKTELLSVDYINCMDKLYAQLLQSLADHDD